MFLCIALLLPLLAGCPNDSGGSGGSGGEEVYRVQAAALSFGEIEAWPAEGPAGTEIELGLYPDEDCAFIPGTLYYRALPEGEKVPLSGEDSPIVFTLPASDVEVGADFRDMAAFTRLMVPVPGKTVNKKTGIAGAPFFTAGTNPVEVGNFKIAAVKVPYQLWYTVRIWAESSERGPIKYSFSENSGSEGTTDTSGDVAQPSKVHKYDPVMDVSWLDAVIWCNAYSDWAREVMGENTQPVYKKDGAVLRVSPFYSYSSTLAPDPPDPGIRGYRLATEAEWEFAARGGDPNAEAWNYQYPGGNNKDEVAWHSGNDGGMSHWVGLKAPNTLGLYDMGGNGREWCWDIYSGTKRVSRGLGLDERFGNNTIISFRVVLPAD
jgi:formylglycine-generating enzyme required for sulfatase activity